MEDESGHAVGSMNPWAETTDFVQNPNWNNYNGFETPFGAMAEILQSWPGARQTSEQNHKTRHLRLISVIAGYPEILTGRRPLDIPLHKKAVLAFKLSDFLDQIKPDSDNSEWHSLRTMLLHYDLIKFNQEEKKTARKILRYLISCIRKNSTYGETQGYPVNQFHREEILFLNSLHSHDTNRIEHYWPISMIEESFQEPPLKIETIYVNTKRDKRNYLEHTFKFDEIHSWISDWSAPESNHLLNENFSQKWIIAASAILESLFAKLRSHIIEEKRPGSIVIDGGGRISYISTGSKEEEQRWFKSKLYSSFLQDPRHPHPFAKTISESIAEYAKKYTTEDKDNFIYQRIYSKDGLEKENGKPFWHKGSPTQALYGHLIGGDSSKYFLPKVVIDPSKERTNKERYLIDHIQPTPWFYDECICCNGQETTLSSMSSCSSIIKEGQFVCPFHYLFESLAESVGIRQTSFNELFLKQPRVFGDGDKRVTHILRFDGNSIGLNFEREFRTHYPPIEPNCLDVWNKEKHQILDINHSWSFREKRSEEENKDYHKLLTDIHNRRVQVLIRKQRRSFSFNSRWWIALRDAMKVNTECSLVPWILAGDDIVLVNKSDSSWESISALLRDFHTNLESSLNNNITFAGSIQDRTNTIIKNFNDAEELERKASWVWKKMAEESFSHLINEKKLLELHEKWEGDSELTHLLEWINSDIAQSYRFGPSGGPVSIIIPSDWKDHSSS